MGGKAYYPIMLDMVNRVCVIVGGGNVAQRKAGSLIEAGAKVWVISPEVTPQLEAWREEGSLGIRREEYRPGLPELGEARLVFAATDQAEVNEQVKKEAEQMDKLFSMADEQSAGGFLVPAVVRRGRLTVAVSTSGASPALAASLKRKIEDIFDAAYEPYLDLLHDLRGAVREGETDTQVRQEMFREMLHWPLLEVLQRNPAGRDGLREGLLERLRKEPTLFGVRRAGEWLLTQDSSRDERQENT
ncbi:MULTISPECIES: precorrin-2 dehydrogenase/sirohydrochlorin ferrochelatase family protein [Paenibacillus]|uniref:precorrin-2 dehydrogenase/sirohydrochlorin ferrochelatase family protein n=1 Tax=Paenibacillus TaxID=44249 RepID=UPI0022B86D25|nr:bifunctional precorrin-2 dehydrogenase/sirohydrochlorin ferrochelatase [Paenibacillus caseinilyticus]MCZ8519109.1 bifunctional precorrin-2 dehydrogenase/sirohydrochlorin ferrochelatase [Paenibacillus caseinilyticus]